MNLFRSKNGNSTNHKFNPRKSATTCARMAISSLMKRFQRDAIRILSTACLLMASTACLVVACTKKGPGAGIRWTSYPSLASTTKSYPWLVVKCQLSDVPTIPAGLDTNIEQFFGISGAGYGNIVDYFHDVSYNHASVISDTFVGWIRAPFSKGDLKGPNGRLSSSVPGRQQRVQECLAAIPADQLPDFDAFYGVVVVNNAVQDGGACYVGQQSLTVNNKSHNLACVWFDPNSLKTEFAAHEIGHGLGLTHSYDDSGRSCGGSPGEYCDPWDIMSAQGTYQFIDSNWITAGSPSGGGPGLDAPGLLNMAWIPAANRREFQFEGDEQIFKIRALSRPRGADPLVVTVNIGGPGPFDGIYTVEYRQGDGWDRGFVTDGSSPSAVRSSGGTVLVHQYRPVGGPVSTLVNGAFVGALQPCNTLVLGNGARHVRVESFDTADGSATVSIGFGRGKFVPCFKDLITNQVDKIGARTPLPPSEGDTVANPAGTPAHIHVPPDAKIQP